MRKPSRRQVLIGGSVALAGVAVAGAFGWKKFRPVSLRPNASDAVVRDYRAAGTDAPADFAISSAEVDPTTLTERAIAALGGMTRFVRSGDVVCIKPNIGWVRTVAQGANTHPDVVAALVRACLKAGAKRVTVTDSSCDEPEPCFAKSGIARAAENAGAQVILPRQELFRDVDIKGSQLDVWPVLSPIIEADRVINVPIAKHHMLTTLTAAMKNWIGLLGGERGRLHWHIDTTISDLVRFLRPTLTVLDATRVLVRNGPRGGNLDDVVAKNTVVAAVDQVAIDSFACTLIGTTVAKVDYLGMAEKLGLGTTQWEALHVQRV